MIQISNLHKKFGKLQVLKSLNLEIKKGGIFVILGPNGSGKTTLIKSILGMVLPDQGVISVDGKSVRGEHLYRGNISYLPQIAKFPENLRVAELLKWVEHLRLQKNRRESLIKLFQLEPFLGKKLSHLSGGTRQKVNIVLSFMFDSELVILDEPTAGLDPVSLLTLKQLIALEKSKTKTILITSHIMSFVEEIADEIVFLLDGEIYFKGTVQAIKEDTQQPNLEHAIARILEANDA